MSSSVRWRHAPEVVLGLDLVELVIATEAAFGIAISDDVVATLDTPRKVIDYLEVRLEPSSASDCLTQLAFYRVRSAVARRFDRPPRSLTPRTPVASLLPERGGETQWSQLGAELGADHWPKWREANWLRRRFKVGPATLGDTSRYLAERYPAAVKGERGWTRAEIEATFLRLLVEITAVDLSKYTLDSRFVDDMGID